MILSIQIRQQEDLDVFSFFPVKNAVQCSSDLWFEAISASLKMKRFVLILEIPFETFPQWETSKRFMVGDNWCWLAPRGLSLITEAYAKNPMSFQEFKTFLKHSK